MIFVKKNRYQGLLLFALLLMFVFCGWAQMNYQQKYQLVQSYLLQREYEKALPILQDVYEVAPEFWFEHYYEALIQTKRYADVEKLLNKQLKKYPNRSDYYVYWGHLYAVQENNKKAEEYYQKALRKLPKDPNVIILTAKQFQKYQLIEYALRVYEKGMELTSYPFYYERAEIFQQTKDYKGLINLYLDLLYSNPGEIVNVQNQMQTLLSYNPDDTTQVLQPVFKQELIKRIQKQPDNAVYVELLVHLLVQQREFEQAFVQVKAYDKRSQDDGLKLFQFCQICSKNQQYSIAEKCFEEVMKKGRMHPFYESARLEYLLNKYNSIVFSSSFSTQELMDLRNRMYQYIRENSNSGIIYPLVLSLADIDARYLQRFERADSLLTSFMEKTQIKPEVKAQFKLKLAEVYVLQNRLWEAILLCMQVEKDFRYEELGQEAQFKRTKISFYSGEFKLAKSQADILKGATSKLIANDALELSMIISDALNKDSTGMVLKYYATAELLMFQNKLDDAMTVLDSINQKFTDHSLEDNIFFQKAKIYEQKQDWSGAEQMYLNILSYYPQEMYADDAAFKLAQLYQFKLNDKTKAMEYYLKVLSDYPGSFYVPEARKMYRTLRGENVN